VFIVGLIVTLLVVDAVLLRLRRRMGQPDLRAAPYGAEQARLLSKLPVDQLRLPGDVFLDRNHTWAKLGAGQSLRVGIDDFAQRFVGRVDDLELPEVGREVRRGEVLFEARQGERRARFRSPVAGVVRATNSGLRAYPEHLKESPYEMGWVVEVEPKDLEKAISPLRIARAATAWMREEMLKLRELVTMTTAPATLPDGGLPADGLLEVSDDATWDAFQTTFLDAE
jgi:glycine cleavage system H protein